MKGFKPFHCGSMEAEISDKLELHTYDREPTRHQMQDRDSMRYADLDRKGRKMVSNQTVDEALSSATDSALEEIFKGQLAERFNVGIADVELFEFREEVGLHGVIRLTSPRRQISFEHLRQLSVHIGTKKIWVVHVPAKGWTKSPPSEAGFEVWFGEGLEAFG